MREHRIRKVGNVVGPQYAFLAKGKLQSTINNVTFGKSKMADADMILLQTFHLPYLIAQYIKVGCTEPEEFWSPYVATNF